MPNPIHNRLAVCSWSLQPGSPAELLDHLDTIGIPRVQLALDPLRENPAIWGGILSACRQRQISIVSGMFGTIGEDYSSLDSIRETGGIVPDATWEKNWRNIRETATHAAALGLKLVSFHAGFLPHDPTDPRAQTLASRLREIAGEFAVKNISLALETGQETADALAAFLTMLDCPNVGVNFDPANMLLYGKGNPINALNILAPWLRQVHIKDARAATTPGCWGEEVVVGTGEVDWQAFFATLAAHGFSGDYCIEREAGTQRAADIIAAKEFLGKLV